MGAVATISKEALKHVEAELYAYQDTKKEIARLREQLMYGKETDDNAGGGQCNIPGRPTERIAVRLVANKTLRNLEEIVDAIDSVYGQLEPSHQKLVYMRYWSGKKSSWDNVSRECNMSIRAAYYSRDAIIRNIAERIGWR